MLSSSLISTAQKAVVMKSANNLPSHLSKVDLRRILTCNNQDVKASAQSVLMQPEELPEPSFHTIAAHCALVDTLADGHSQSAVHSR